MGGVKSDIEIARAAKMKPISEVLAKINVPDDPVSFSPMGRHVAKLNFEYIDKLKEKKSNLILVTAITPTPAGVGVIAVTKIKLFFFSFNLSINSKFNFAICRPIGLKETGSSGTLSLARTWLIGCILAALAISISDFTLLIGTPIYKKEHYVYII